MAFRDVGAVEDFPLERAVEVRIGARQIAVYHTEGRFHAVKNVCPHQGISLHLAPPRDGCAVCNGHGWEFDLLTGDCVRGQKSHRIAVYPVKVEKGRVLVDVG